MSLTKDVQVDCLPPELRKRVDELSLLPLWESKLSHASDSGPPDDGNLWRWEDLNQVLGAVAELYSPAVVERRVLELMDPRARYARGEAAIGTITATVQMLKPGERARPHRHSMNAVRFVLQSTGGAKTIVDGKDLPMETGDLVLTPAWCWHAHEHEGKEPITWIDVLDLPLHRFLGTEAFQPGPVVDAYHQIPDLAFATPNLLPCLEDEARDYSPVFRYPWQDAVRALEATPAGVDGARRVRYVNPMTGGAGLAFLDLGVVQVDAALSTQAAASVADMVLHVVEGCGIAYVGETEYPLTTKDILTVPGGRPLRLHAAGDGPLRIFTASNAPVFAKLGLVSRDAAQ
ncbi:cupin domain-containing protein [Sphingobium lactosutens]|uniref:cupin domain-containing protein n=1 Tax=Sphingobium lactosutens TaxID=522773 RepID=UPI0015BDED85|nr:cupin domain-containing protein [Sphingobium lactosutens]